MGTQIEEHLDDIAAVGGRHEVEREVVFCGKLVVFLRHRNVHCADKMTNV